MLFLLLGSLRHARAHLKGSMADQVEQHTTREPALSPSSSGFSWYRDWVLLATVSAILAMDQLTKYLVRTNLLLGESWPDEGFLRLTHGTNSGSAFGLFSAQTPLLIVASLVAIGFLIYFYRTHALPSPLLRFAIGMILGGAVGNLIDRLRAGSVVDFIDVGPWPIFNVADSSIVVGMAILFGVLVLSDQRASAEAGPKSGEPTDSAGR